MKIYKKFFSIILIITVNAPFANPSTVLAAGINVDTLVDEDTAANGF